MPVIIECLFSSRLADRVHRAEASLKAAVTRAVAEHLTYTDASGATHTLEADSSDSIRYAGYAWYPGMDQVEADIVVSIWQKPNSALEAKLGDILVAIRKQILSSFDGSGKLTVMVEFYPVAPSHRVGP